MHQLLLTFPHEPRALRVTPLGLFSLPPGALCVPFSLILVAPLSPARLSQDVLGPGATWNLAHHVCRDQYARWGLLSAALLLVSQAPASWPTGAGASVDPF